MTYRFEYTSLYPPRRTESDPVALPQLHRTLQMPITFTGLAIWASSVLLQNLIPVAHQPIEDHGMSIASICITWPSAVVSIVGASWWSGRLDEWWGYRET